MMKVIDNLFTGMICGLVAPVFTFYIYCRVSFPFSTFMEEVKLFDARKVLSHAVSLSVLINLLIFFVFIWSKKDRSAKGVIGATIIYAIFIAYLQLR